VQIYGEKEDNAFWIFVVSFKKSGFFLTPMPSRKCFPCLQKIAFRAVELSTTDIALRERLQQQLKQKIKAHFPELLLPDFSTELFADIAAATGVRDPFLEIKAQSNRIFLELLPRIIAPLTSLSPDERLKKLFLFSIAANLVDFSTGEHEVDLSSIVQQFFSVAGEELAIDDFSELLSLLHRSEQIIILSDNCGEVVIDNYLAGYLTSELDKETFLGLKGAPIANDCTIADFKRDNLPYLATEVFAVSDAFGYNWHEVSDRFKELLSEADLLLVKGQSNYETTVNNLVRHPELSFPPIFCILRTKCEVISNHLGVSLGSNVIKQMFPLLDKETVLTEIAKS